MTGTANVITASSGVSARSGDPFVRLDWGSQAGQLTVEEARGFALNVLQAADAAESDYALITALGGKLDEVTGSLLVAVRHERDVRAVSGVARAEMADPEPRS